MGGSCLDGKGLLAGTGVVAQGSRGFVVSEKDSCPHCCELELESVGMVRVPVRGRDSAIGGRWMDFVEAEGVAGCRNR